VKQLQRDHQEQMGLEFESQATFEYLNSQVQALHAAFNTLSDVVMDEIDAVRSESRRKMKEMEETVSGRALDSCRADGGWGSSSRAELQCGAQISRHVKNFADSQQEVNMLKRSLDVLVMKDRDWAKDTEILKVSLPAQSRGPAPPAHPPTPPHPTPPHPTPGACARRHPTRRQVSHAHTAEWMQQMSRDVMATRELVSALKADTAAAVSQAAEGLGSMRVQLNAQCEALNVRFIDFDRGLGEVREDGARAAAQRLDDLDLTEHALSALQKQAARTRAGVDEAAAAARADAAAARARSEEAAAAAAAARGDVSELARALSQSQHDARARFDNIARVFTVFSEALHIPPPAGLHAGIGVPER
jgi:hypothetical protein